LPEGSEGELVITSISKEAFRGAYRLNDLALIYVRTGEYMLAFETLDTVLSNPGVLSINLLLLDPRWKPIWDHPDFNELAEIYVE